MYHPQKYKFFKLILVLVFILSGNFSAQAVTMNKKKHRPEPPKEETPPPYTDINNKFCIVDYTPIRDGKEYYVFYKRKRYKICSQKCLGLFKLDPKRYTDRWDQIENGKVEMIEPEKPDPEGLGP